jgi:hypothetical protein
MITLSNLLFGFQPISATYITPRQKAFRVQQADIYFSRKQKTQPRSSRKQPEQYLDLVANNSGFELKQLQAIQHRISNVKPFKDINYLLTSCFQPDYTNFIPQNDATSLVNLKGFMNFQVPEKAPFQGFCIEVAMQCKNWLTRNFKDASFFVVKGGDQDWSTDPNSNHYFIIGWKKNRTFDERGGSVRATLTDNEFPCHCLIIDPQNKVIGIPASANPNKDSTYTTLGQRYILKQVFWGAPWAPEPSPDYIVGLSPHYAWEGPSPDDYERLPWLLNRYSREQLSNRIMSLGTVQELDADPEQKHPEWANKTVWLVIYNHQSGLPIAGNNHFCDLHILDQSDGTAEVLPQLPAGHPLAQLLQKITTYALLNPATRVWYKANTPQKNQASVPNGQIETKPRLNQH